MPIVRIDIQAGKSTAYKRDILHAVRSAITESLEVPDDRVMQRIIETPAEDIDAPEVRTDRLTVIEVSMLPGRDAARKAAMYAAIVAHLGERPGIHKQDITVMVNDPSAECFALGGVMQCNVPSDALPSDSGDRLAAQAPAPLVAAAPEDAAPPAAPEPAEAPPTPPLAAPAPAENPEA